MVVRKEISLCILSAFLLILSFPRFNFEFLAWVGFVPLFLAIRDKPKIKAFLLSYLTGIIFWLGIIYWLVHVTLPGMILLVLYLALYFGIFGFIISTIDYKPSTMNLLFIPSLWVLLEYLRSHLLSGFPWALLGYCQYLNLPVIQIADITGVWGVSFLIMMINVAIYSVVSCPLPALPRRQAGDRQELSVVSRIKRFLFPILCVFIVLSYGYYKLHQTSNTKYQTLIRISVIQGNIPQELKWDARLKDSIIDRYLTLTRQAIKDSPDLVVWPEATIPAVLEEEPVFYERVKGFVKEIKTPILLGAATRRNNLYYNSALLISSEGKLLDTYDKLHLVPFGEYIPLRKTLTFLETVVPIGDFTPGREYTIFKIPAWSVGRPNNFGVLICFEDLFPGLSRGFSRRGADFIINITNDAWFQKTSSPYQHLQASVFRAVENRLFLVRAANTGISGFIAPTGGIISLVQDELGRNIFISGYDTQEIVIPKKELSFYTRYGDIFVIACFLFVLYAMVLRSRYRNIRS